MPGPKTNIAPFLLLTSLTIIYTISNILTALSPIQCVTSLKQNQIIKLSTWLLIDTFRTIFNIVLLVYSDRVGDDRLVIVGYGFCLGNSVVWGILGQVVFWGYANRGETGLGRIWVMLYMCVLGVFQVIFVGFVGYLCMLKYKNIQYASYSKQQ